MARFTSKQILIGLVVACGGVAIAEIGDGGDVAPGRANFARESGRSAPQDASAGAPGVQIERLVERAPAPPGRDLFEPHQWTAPARKPRVVVETAPSPPQAPAVPYAYLGKWSERDRVTVILGREGHTYLARAGEVLDETWRIDSIEATSLAITYLPLDVRQTLAFDRSGAAGAAGAKPVTADKADALLRVTAPAQVTPAEEFSIVLTLDARAAAAVENGRVEMLYDAKVLNAVAVGSRVIEGRRSDPGRVVVELDEASAMVRLRVVADEATATEIRFANLSASDPQDRAVAVAVDGPNPRPLAIVQASNRRQAATQ
jgi:hypothetical protein